MTASDNLFLPRLFFVSPPVTGEAALRFRRHRMPRKGQEKKGFGLAAAPTVKKLPLFLHFEFTDRYIFCQGNCRPHFFVDRKIRIRLEDYVPIPCPFSQ
jgi:hypothetical protein